jgi:hypothetical protein
MVRNGNGPLHCSYLGNAKTKRIGVIPTPWASIPVLGLAVLHHKPRYGLY